MKTILIYAPSEDLYDALEHRKDIFSGSIEFQYRESSDIKIVIGDKSIGVKLPVRLGTVLDVIQKEVLSSASSKNIYMGDHILKPRDLLLVQPDKETVLTEKERDILLCILGEPSHMISKEGLLQKVWGYGENIETHTLETHIYRLRQKIEENPATPTFLVTTEDGYKLSLS